MTKWLMPWLSVVCNQLTLFCQTLRDRTLAWYSGAIKAQRLCPANHITRCLVAKLFKLVGMACKLTHISCEVLWDSLSLSKVCKLSTPQAAAFHRLAHTNGRDGQKNACFLACGHIDGVITHTKTSNQLQAGLVGP